MRPFASTRLAPLALALSACSALIDADPGSLGGNPPQTVDPVGDPRCAAQCDDGNPCTLDGCDANEECVHTPDEARCDDGIGCTVDSCDATLGCTHQPSNERCDFCAPGSVCDVEIGGCIQVTSTRDCGDDDPCTADACSVALMQCVNELLDFDEDGAGVAQVGGNQCGGEDCDDSDPTVHPGADEVCDGKDNNCDGRADDGCGPLPDSCETAQTIELTSDQAMIGGSFAQLGSDHAASCGSQGARDAVYRIAIDRVSDIVLESEGSATQVVLAVGASCDDSGFGLGCAAPMASGRTRLAVHRFDPSRLGGELFVRVAAHDGAGDYRVSLRVTPAAPDMCGAQAFDHSECGTLVGFMPLISTGAGMIGSCRSIIWGALGGESALRVRGNAGGRLALSVRSEDFAPTLFARPSCDGFDLACDTAQNGLGAVSGSAEIELALGEAEEAFVTVDDGSSGGRYTLSCE